jgi:hypothetical protein
MLASSRLSMADWSLRLKPHGGIDQTWRCNRVIEDHRPPSQNAHLQILSFSDWLDSVWRNPRQSCRKHWEDHSRAVAQIAASRSETGRRVSCSALEAGVSPPKGSGRYWKRGKVWIHQAEQNPVGAPDGVRDHRAGFRPKSSNSSQMEI